ncbi:MAG: helix-turn-helix domain-containing protein [Planctomycetaceae bacterium]|nr:helix-turn-helix domain-containing protein [Planctomycetaceae bacterium]
MSAATVAAPQTPKYQNTLEAADYLRISVSALKRLHDIPKAKLRGRIIYRTEALDEYVRSHEAK